MQQEKHINSKEITIFRAGSFLSRAQGKDIQDYFAESKVSIGSYFESETSSKIATGMSYEEEDLIMPHVVDAVPKDRDFRKKVSDYFIDLDIKIPFKGRVFEIGLLGDNTQPVSIDNMPINVSDYIQCRVAMRHPHMAPSKEAAEANPVYQCYVFDKDVVIEKAGLRTKEKDDALKLFYAIENEPIKVREMLLLMGKDPREFSGKNADALRIAALRELAEKKSALFITTGKQEDLSIRYWVTAMIKSGVLKQVGPRIQAGEGASKTIVGNSMEEAIAFFLDDEKNDELITILKSQQQEMEKTIPKSIPLQTRKLNEA